MTSTAAQDHYIRWFEQIGIEDVPLVGGKNASLGEMIRELAPQGIKVPNGFAITAEAYWYFLRAANSIIKSGRPFRSWTPVTPRTSAARQRGSRMPSWPHHSQRIFSIRSWTPTAS